MQHVTTPKEHPTTATIATTSLALEKSNSKNVANIKIILFDSFERLARGIKFRTSLLYNNGFSAYLCSLILGFRLASRRQKTRQKGNVFQQILSPKQEKTNAGIKRFRAFLVWNLFRFYFDNHSSDFITLSLSNDSIF